MSINDYQALTSLGVFGKNEFEILYITTFSDTVFDPHLKFNSTSTFSYHTFNHGCIIRPLRRTELLTSRIHAGFRVTLHPGLEAIEYAQ